MRKTSKTTWQTGGALMVAFAALVGGCAVQQDGRRSDLDHAVVERDTAYARVLDAARNYCAVRYATEEERRICLGLREEEARRILTGDQEARLDESTVRCERVRAHVTCRWTLASLPSSPDHPGMVSVP